MILSFAVFKIKFTFPSFKELIYQVKDGWHIFLSTLGMNFYRESNTIILGFLTNFSVVGYYAAAEKLIKVIQSLTAPFVNVLFPYFGRRLNVGENIAKNLKLYKKLGAYYGLLLLIISISVLFFAPWGIKTYLSSAYISSVINIQIMCMVIFFGGLNYYYGIIGLVNMGKEKLFAKAVWISGVFSVCICFLLSGKLLDKGASLAMVLAEFLLFMQILFYSKNVIKKHE
jgi:PST family polysaccharide transporter